MIVLTDEEEQSTPDSTLIRRPRNVTCCCPRIIHRLAICVSLYAVISSLLIPLTVRGRIGGQYGVLVEDEKLEGQPRKFRVILSVTDLPSAVELGLAIFMSLAHLAGVIAVIKKSTICMNGYILYRCIEIGIHFYWFISIGGGFIKSHTMSQFSLECYCFFGFAMSVMSLGVYIGATYKYAYRDYKIKKGYDV